MKYGSLNLLEPSGPHRACYRTPLLYLHPEVKSVGYLLMTNEFSMRDEIIDSVC